MKNLLTIAAVLAAIILLFFVGCGGCKKTAPVKNDTVTVVKVDSFIDYSVIHDTIHDIAYKYTPAKVTTVYERDTLLLPSAGYDLLRQQYEGLLAAHYGTNTYSKKYEYKNGFVTINDTLSENEVKGRSIEIDAKYKVITKTETIKIPEPPKRQFYAGFGAAGSKDYYLQQASVDLYYKGKNQVMYGVNTVYDMHYQQQLFGVKVLAPIK